MKPRSGKPGTKNIVGLKVVELRTKRKIKQKDFLAQLQILGMDISGNRTMKMRLCPFSRLKYPCTQKKT